MLKDMVAQTNIDEINMSVQFEGARITVEPVVSIALNLTQKDMRHISI